MFQVELDEAKVRLLDLINAAISGEEVFIVKGNKSIVQLVPVEKVQRQPQFGSAKGLIEITDDFDAPFGDFGPYMFGGKR